MKRLKHLKKGLAFLVAAVLIVSVFPISPKTVRAANAVYIPDDALRAAIIEKLNLSENADITKEQLESLTQLSVGSVSAPVSDLTGIQFCTNLGTLKLTLPSDHAVDLTPLENLPALVKLELDSGKVSGLPQIQKLEELHMDYCEIPDPAFISNLTNLRRLDCYETAIEKLPDCSGMNSLKMLTVTSTSALTDISGISGCTSLTAVDLGNCYELTDISPLNGLSLRSLDLQWVKITAENEASYMETISSLSVLEQLNLGLIGLEDKHVSMFDNLNLLKQLNVRSNNLTSADFLLPHKDTLEEVTIRSNPISDSTPLGKLTKLKAASVGGTNITDFSFISQLPDFTGDCLWDIEWTERAPAKPRVSITDSYDEGTLNYVIPNPFKDENGNRIAPKESEEYSYNAATREITVPINGQSAISKDIEFPCTFTTQKGETLFAQPHIILELTRTQTTPLVITKQPQDVEVAEGGKATLTVEASGSGTLSYQWYKGDDAIIGATSSSFTISNAALSDSGSYHVVVTNTNSSVTSNSAEITVNAIPLLITTQPQGITLTEGENGTLAVEASGSGTLSYQWYKGDDAIIGATSSSFTISDAALSDAGSYTVVVTDKNGSITSAPAVVTVTAAAIPLKITKHPVGADITEGGSATLTVEASGSGTLSYQWYKGDDVISGATSSSFTISDAALSDAGSYTVVVTDTNDSITSNPAVITVTAIPIPLEITAQPQNVNIPEGGNVTLTVEASGSGALSYQWFKNNTALSGATASALAIINAALSDAGSYHVVVTDTNGNSETSDSAEVTVTATVIPLNITKHPVGVRITEGGNATLTVEASGSGTLSYQWYKGDDAISGATSSSFTISDADLSDSGSYHVVVTDTNDSITSDSAVVTVIATVIPLNITKHPVGVRITEGENATLTVEASGSGTLSYQWYKGDDAISGATSSSFTISDAALSDSGSYTVEVTDTNDSITSNPAVVTVTAIPIPLEITAQPQNVNIPEGESATLTVEASGSGTLSYQWFKGDEAISGATSSSLTISNAALSDAGSYHVVVTDQNDRSETSNPAVVTVTPIPLEITAQPQNVNIPEGENATLTVEASGSGTLSYQWYKDGKAIIIAEGRAVSSVASSSLTISNAALEDAGSYTVVVTDKNDSITSDPIVVTITQKETPTETETPSENEEEAETETEAPVQPKAPLTGDSFSWINYIVLFLSAMTTLIWKKSKL